MSKVIETIYTLQGEIKITKRKVPGTTIELGTYFTSISGGYWDGKIIECVGFDKNGFIYGSFFVYLHDEAHYIELCDSQDTDVFDDELCLCGGDAFHSLQSLDIYKSPTN